MEERRTPRRCGFVESVLEEPARQIGGRGKRVFTVMPVAVLVTVSLAAALIPARRAARVDPLTTIRGD
ncbi:MAG: hypothetical protein ACC682_06290 [Gemmatimonadota bacterium]